MTIALTSVDWSKQHGTYRTMGEFPELLSALRNGSDELRSRARRILSEELEHQGTRMQVGGTAVPFLIALVDSLVLRRCAPGDRANDRCALRHRVVIGKGWRESCIWLHSANRAPLGCRRMSDRSTFKSHAGGSDNCGRGARIPSRRPTSRPCIGYPHCLAAPTQRALRNHGWRNLGPAAVWIRSYGTASHRFAVADLFSGAMRISRISDSRVRAYAGRKNEPAVARVSRYRRSSTVRREGSVHQAHYQLIVQCWRAELVFACWVTNAPAAVDAVVRNSPLLCEAMV